ncbi:MAG: hypothetical protein IT461_08820 [Planctomycetes bacterium]|nr:hypothetical protein [Planctomycetota bacterium]
MFNQRIGLKFGSLFAAAALLLVLGGSLWAQDKPADDKPADEEGTEARKEITTPLDPNKEITIDFVRKDIHVVMHYIGLRSGLNITVEGDITKELTVIFRDIKPIDAIKSICESNELVFIQNGTFIYIKKRPDQAPRQANVTKGSTDQLYNVSFDNQELLSALLETARVTNTPAFMPALTQDMVDKWRGTLTELEQILERVTKRKVGMYMRDAKPEQIFTRLADMGDLLKDGDPVNGYTFRYKEIKYRPPQPGTGTPQPTEGPQPDDVKFVTKSWILPGVKIADTAQQLRNLMSTSGRMAYDVENTLIQVTDTEARMVAIVSFMETLQQQNQARLEKKPLDQNNPLTVRTYESNRDVTDPEFKNSLQSVLSENGKVVVNPDRNSVIIYDRLSQFKSIDRFFAAFDAEPQQVLLTSKLCEITLDDYIGYGLQIFTEHGAQNLNNGRFTGSSFGTASRTVGNMFGQTTGFGPFVGTFVSERVNVTLEMLANDGKVETLIMPTSMVSNKKKAKITVGQEVPYLETSSASGGTATATVAFKEIATVMEVTPTILADGLIRLDITFTIKEQISTISIQSNDTPVLSNRESVTNVFVRDGETLVIGGLIRERERNQENGIPFLKDIPLLGYLFKTKNKRTEKTDLLFFLRPTIVTQGARGPMAREVDLEREGRPQVWDDDDIQKLKLVASELVKPGAMPKPNHYDTSKRPKTVKDVNPNE